MGVDATPQIDPEESPLMTWGEVESTPYRLEGCETPLLRTGKAVEGGPSFTMQQVPKRDRIGLELAERNSKFYRDKKGQAIYKARCNIKTPKSVGNLGSITPGRRLPSLSPAAQRLASSKLGIRLGTDKVLSAAYNSPSHHRLSSSQRSTRRTPSLLPTPGRNTPLDASSRSAISKSVRKTSANADSTPKQISGSNTPNITNEDRASLTDNLLKLPTSAKASVSNKSDNPRSSERAKASDFFA